MNNVVTQSSIRVATVLAVFAMTQTANAATVLFENHTVTVENTLADPNDLWVMPEDLPGINGFELKPEGACLDEICVPVRRDEDSALFVTRSGQPWFSVTELARRLQQSYAHDAVTDTWSFGEIPAVRDAQLQSATAPDFELQDRQGKTVRLSDFRGKKVLLMTWASW